MFSSLERHGIFQSSTDFPFCVKILCFPRIGVSGNDQSFIPSFIRTCFAFIPLLNSSEKSERNKDKGEQLIEIWRLINCSFPSLPLFFSCCYSLGEYLTVREKSREGLVYTQIDDRSLTITT